MENTDTIKTCQSCGFTGFGNFCRQCGQQFEVRRLTLKALLYDIIHLFTKFEKGFGHTLKQLIIEPGKMQRSYIAGNRKKNQSPFSMFFICATISALLRFWILNYLMTTFHSADPVEVKFFKEYMVVLYILLVPLYALVTYLFFYKSGYNYTELIVLLLYTVSVILLVSPVLFLLLFIWPKLDVMYIEFVIYAVYFAITFVNFFNTYTRWKVILMSILCLAVAFIINQVAEDLAMKILY